MLAHGSDFDALVPATSVPGRRSASALVELFWAQDGSTPMTASAPWTGRIQRARPASGHPLRPASRLATPFNVLEVPIS
jgi:hypothetical protein